MAQPLKYKGDLYNALDWVVGPGACDWRALHPGVSAHEVMIVPVTRFKKKSHLRWLARSTRSPELFALLTTVFENLNFQKLWSLRNVLSALGFRTTADNAC